MRDSTVHDLRSRWLDEGGNPKPVVEKVVSALIAGGDIAPMVRDLPFAGEIENGRDLRGLRLVGVRLLAAETQSRTGEAVFSPVSCRDIDFSYAAFIQCDLRGIRLGQYIADAVTILSDGASFTSKREDDPIPSGQKGHPSRLDFANFTSCLLEDSDVSYCSCISATFLSCDMKRATLEGADLRQANLAESDLEAADLRATRLSGASLTNAILDGAIVDYRTDFGRSLVWGEPDERADVYRRVKLLYREAGLHSSEDFFYYKEMAERRRTKNRWSPVRWLEFVFVDLTCGYGVRPARVVAWMAVVIVACAFIYWTVALPVSNLEAARAPGLLDCLYFSIVTFTTLGFGDWVPSPVSGFRFVASLEALMGALLVALAVVTYARRTLRS